MQSEQRTAKLFRSSPYLKSCESVVLETSANGEVVVDQTVFYAAGGGQPGDSGNLLWENNHVRIVDARYAADGAIKLLPETGSPVPNPGDEVRQELDWDRRYQHMRIHTAPSFAFRGNSASGDFRSHHRGKGSFGFRYAGIDSRPGCSGAEVE